MTTLKTILLLACVSAMATCASALGATAASTRIVLVPGKSVAFAILHARVEARTATLRRAWLASGHSPGAVAAPAIVSGNITTPAIDVATAPAAPGLAVKYRTGGPGLAYIDADFISSSSDQVLVIDYNTPLGVPLPAHGTLSVLQPEEVRAVSSFRWGEFGLYSAPGTWTLEDVTLVDNAGNQTFYSQTQLATLFPSLTITVSNGGTPDVTPPAATGGQVLTPVVKLSSPAADFIANLTVSDDLSGVDEADVFVQPPGQQGGFADTFPPPVPVANGTVQAVDSLAGQATGTWTIEGYEVCDVAGNCLQDFIPSDVQSVFGTTTFKVKN